MSHTLILLFWNVCLVIPLAALAWCACRFRAVRLRPALCHGIWLLVLLKLITPPLISVPVLPAWHVFDRDVDFDSTQSTARNVAAPARGTIPMAAVVPEDSTPVRGAGVNRKPMDGADLAESAGIEFATDDPARLTPRRTEVAESRGRRPAFSWRELCVGFVAVSFLITLCCWVAAIRQIQRVRRLLPTRFFTRMSHGGDQGTRTERRTRQLLAEVSRIFGEFEAIPSLAIVEAAVVPMVWADPISRAKQGGANNGRACVILSQPLVDSLDDDQLRSVIAHELAHCARRDHWTNIFGFCVATLFWWHPVAWFARRELGHAAEACCDAMVIEKLAGSRKSYAQTLLKVVDFIQAHALPQPVLALTFGGSSSLRKRFQMLASHDVQSRVSRSGWWFLVMLGAATLALVPARAQEKPGTPETRGTPEILDAAKAPGAKSSHSKSEDAQTLAGPAIDGSKPDEVQAATVPSENAKSDGSLEEGHYYVVGSVVEEDSKQPIAGANLRFLIDGEPNIDKKLVRAATDEKGRFRVEVPVGNMRLWFPELKAGYWLTPTDNTKALATSVDKPTATLDLEARRGPVWPVQVMVEGGISENIRLQVSVNEVEDDAARAKWLKGEPVSFMKPLITSMTTLDNDGRGSFTQCGTSGKFFLSIDGNSAGRGFPEVGQITTEFIVDPTFDMTRVKTVNRAPGTDKVELIDEQGAKATIAKAQVTVTNGRPLFTFQLPRIKHAIQEFVGRVVDAAGQPIADVRVGVAAGVKGGGSGEWSGKAMTDAEGKFQLKVPHIETNQDMVLIFSFNKDGFACSDSGDFPLPKKPSAAMDVGKFTLQAARWLPLRVVDQDDRPVAGVAVEPTGSYAVRRMAIRTDAEGRGILKNLPVGTVSVTLIYPGQNEHRKLVVSSLQTDNRETKLRLKTTVGLPAVAANPREAIAAGQAAPEWEIETWTDGKSHTLADYRGRVVVLDFWGIWCGGCVRGIPMMQELAEKYQSQGVAFLGIHTPDGDLDQIGKLKKDKGWKAATGIDRGSSVADGASAARYGVRGYPSIIVIDSEGKVAFNSTRELQDQDALLKEMRQLAESLQIPWPLPEDESDEALSHMNKFLGAMFSREIDKVLAAGKK